MRVEQATDPVASHGEGPVWPERWGGLRWVDMLGADVLSLAADSAIHWHHVGRVAAALRPRRRGGAVIGVERGFTLEDADGMLAQLGELWTDDWARMNEGGCRFASSPGERSDRPRLFDVPSGRGCS
jgi:sugar lactone lactonase YvrE